MNVPIFCTNHLTAIALDEIVGRLGWYPTRWDLDTGVDDEENSVCLMVVDDTLVRSGLIGAVFEKPPRCPLVVMISGGVGSAVVSALSGIARAILLPDPSEDQINSTLVAVAAGYTVFPVTADEEMGSYDEEEKAPLLSPRETQIWGRLAYGASNKEIARSLKIKERTVEVHVSSMLRKLNVQNRTQAALAYGLTHPRFSVCTLLPNRGEATPLARPATTRRISSSQPPQILRLR
jgi:DNA-binding CsgD family transcriptional regulator